MRKRATQYFEELEKLDLNEEFRCVNALQQTPWAINKRVLAVLRQAWDSGQEWGGLPPRDDLPLPPYPFDVEPSELTEGQMKDFKLFRKRRGEVHQHNNRTMSLRILIERTLQMAEEYAERDEFYYVWQLDFRGRKYPMESFMSPQTGDAGKALLTFAYGVPIKNDEDAKWLAIHGANVYGNDKISLEDREMFAYMNTDMAKAVSADPYSNTQWLEADKPWQFLAWCFEWADYREVVERGMGEEFITYLPCHADGTCNGLQHLSAILRDEEGGKSVNLLPSDIPMDIYADVAVAATDRIRLDTKDSGNLLAHRALQYGIDRKMTKRSVMIVPYSGTRFACRDYVVEAIDERTKKTGLDFWGDDKYKAANYISNHIWEAINDKISSARTVMDYIRSIGDLYAKNQIVMQWTTPTGFLVWQSYSDMYKRRIKTAINGSIVKLNYMGQVENSVSRSKTLSGSSPNFIHSMDAAALTMTVNRCVDAGMRDFAMVHDSYGTHSTNMPAMSQFLREAFVDLYNSNDVLKQLYDHAVKMLPNEDIPLPPTRGKLNIKDVLESEYFFS